MEKDKLSNNNGNLSLPPYSSSNLTTRNTRLGGETSSSLVLDSSDFSQDICIMPDNPPKQSGHRRAHSEILTLPDDISFHSDLGVVGGEFNGPDEIEEEDLFSMYLDMDKLNSASATSGFREGVTPQNGNENLVERPRVRHQHSQSMDGSSSVNPEMLSSAPEGMSSADAKKSISAAKLAELALVDPKRAKRIWANRQSAARSKERKMRYIGELERKVHAMKTEATSLSAQLTLMQRDTSGLTATNSELKLRLQTMEQQVHMQDALNEALKDEIQHLKVLVGQTHGNSVNFSPQQSSFGLKQQQFYPNNHDHSNRQQQSMNTLLTAQQLQQLQIQSQKQQHHFQQQQHLHQFQQQQQQEQQSSE